MSVFNAHQFNYSVFFLYFFYMFMYLIIMLSNYYLSIFYYNFNVLFVHYYIFKNINLLCIITTIQFKFENIYLYTLINIYIYINIYFVILN